MLTDLPNILTLSRIVAIPVLVALVAMGAPVTDCAACLLFIVAAITDYLDGKLARAWHQYSDLGRMLDPIADKLLVGASLMMLAGCGRLPFGTLYPAVIILAREILISGLREFLASTRVSMPVTRLAKWKTGIQMTAIGFLLAGNSTGRLLHLEWMRVSMVGAVMLWIAAALTVLTGWDYLMTGLRHIGRNGETSKIAS
jgi:cardiolipin synthase (CMP-forming)